MPAMLRSKSALKTVSKIIKNNPEEKRQLSQKDQKTYAENPYMREMRLTIKR